MTTRKLNPTALDQVVLRFEPARERGLGFLPFLRRFNLPFARLALFVVYFWFGALKLVGVSPAGPLVSALWLKTIPFIPLDKFIILFASYEMLIGILFLIPRLERLAITLLLLHVSTTVLPLVLLPDIVWQMFLVPSLEGQYIIKNIVVVALALSIGASLRARRDSQPVPVTIDCTDRF
jgi:uncharacterized membrane protein YkgB